MQKHNARKPEPEKTVTGDDARHAEIARLLRDSLDARHPKIALSYYGSITVRRGVSRLVNLAGTRRRKSWSDSFQLAAAELAREGIERSRQREAEIKIVNLLRWLQAAREGLSEPPPAPKPAPAPRRPPAKRRPGFRRLPINISLIVDCGIEPKDTALVALGCEARAGEWAYARVPADYGDGYYLSMIFPCEQDEHCDARRNGGRRDESLCLRYEPRRCYGKHSDGAVILGRIVGVERHGEPIETTLNLRLCDEREYADAAARNFEPCSIPTTNDEWEGFDLIDDEGAR